MNMEDQMGEASATSRFSLEDQTVVKEKDGVVSLGNTPPQSIHTTTKELPSSSTATDDWVYITGFKLFAIVGAVTAAVFILLLDTSIVVAAIPRITSDFHSLEDIGWYGSAYLLTSCALQPLAGKIYNRFETKFTFIFFVAFFEFGSLICGVAVNSKMLIIGRALSGCGASGLTNGAITIISSCVPLEKRAIYFGTMMGISQLGILLGPLVGGLLTQYATWRWCFYINLPIGGIILFVLFLIQIPDRRVQSNKDLNRRETLQSLDLPGLALFTPTTVMFLLALEWGGTTYKWNSSIIIGLFCGAAGMLVVFLAWEKKRKDTAMIPLSLLKQRVVWSSCLTYGFIGANMISTSYYMAIYFQAVKGVQPTLSGVYLLPAILSQMITAVGSGILVGRIGYYLPFIIVADLLASVGTGLISSLKPHSSPVTWIFFQIIAASGRGTGLQMPIIAIQNSVKPEMMSIGMSTVSFTQSFGSALFLSFAQTIFSASLKTGLQEHAPSANATAVIDAGATNFRSIVPVESLENVLVAYDQAVNHAFYLITGAAVAAFFSCFGMGCKSVKAKAVVPEA